MMGMRGVLQNLAHVWVEYCIVKCFANKLADSLMCERRRNRTDRGRVLRSTRTFSALARAIDAVMK